MSRALRWWVLGLGVAGMATVLALAYLRMPAFGTAFHPYRDAAVAAAVAHRTANVVSAVNFDQRGLDTLGEETILLGSILAVVALLRPAKEERTRRTPGDRAPLQATRWVGYLLFPLTLIVGLDIVVHGHVTPGGGFQGGIMLATGLHLVYVAGRYRSLEQLQQLPVLEVAEAVATTGFVALGLAGAAVAGAFLANFVPLGSFGQLLSAGTVPILNGAVGVAVGSGGIVLLAQFFRQVFLVSEDEGDEGDGDDDGERNRAGGGGNGGRAGARAAAARGRSRP